MTNDQILVKKIKELHEQNEISDENYNAFTSHHFFTNYKIESAYFFQEKLEEIHKNDPTGIVWKRHKEARRYIDCVLYMLIGAYDGLLHEINCIFDLCVSPESLGFRKSLLDKLKYRSNRICDKINKEWKDWINNLNDERVDYTHIKVRGKRIIKNMWEERVKVYDREDEINGEQKEELVEKMRRYCNSMSKLIDEIYGLLANEL